MIRGIREGGPDFEICIEAHAKFNVDSAIRIIKAVEPHNPCGSKSPFRLEMSDAMVRVQRQSSVPIAAGERLKSRLEVREYIERDALRILQPDARASVASPSFARWQPWLRLIGFQWRRTIPMDPCVWQHTCTWQPRCQIS